MQVHVPDSPRLGGLAPPDEDDFSHLLESPTALAAKYKGWWGSFNGGNNSDLAQQEAPLGSPDYAKQLNRAGLFDQQQDDQQGSGSGGLLRQLSGGLLLPELVLQDAPSCHHATHRLAPSADRLHLLALRTGARPADAEQQQHCLNSLGPDQQPLTPRAAAEQPPPPEQPAAAAGADHMAAVPHAHIVLTSPGIQLKPLHTTPLAPGLHHLQQQQQQQPHGQPQQQQLQLPSLVLAGQHGEQQQQQPQQQPQQQQATPSLYAAAAAAPSQASSHSQVPPAAAPGLSPAAAAPAPPARPAGKRRAGAEAGQHTAAKPAGQELAAGNCLVWAKVARFPWWPAITVSPDDPTAAAAAKGGSGSGSGAVLLRFLGTHDAAWLDPVRAVSPWQQSRGERSGKTKARVFLLALEEAAAFLDSGVLPEAFSSPLQLTPAVQPAAQKSKKQRKASPVASPAAAASSGRNPSQPAAGGANAAGEAPHSARLAKRSAPAAAAAGQRPSRSSKRQKKAQ